jgi:hypothetical protein
VGADLEGTTQFKLFLDGEVNGVTEHGPRIKKKNIGGAPGFPVGRTASACLFSFFFFFFYDGFGGWDWLFYKTKKNANVPPSPLHAPRTPHAMERRRLFSATAAPVSEVLLAPPCSFSRHPTAGRRAPCRSSRWGGGQRRGF